MNVDAAADILRAGGVVAHATEGVWGFACDPCQLDAVQKVLTLKARQAEKGLLLIAGQASDFKTELAAHDQDLIPAILASWPGPNTWVLPNVRYDVLLTGGRETIACRVPGHDQARAVAAAFGGPLVSTSANVSGASALTEYEAVMTAFAEHVDLVLPGKVNTPGQASQIFDLSGQRIR